MVTISDQHSLEVGRYPLSDLEKDALQHFQGKVSLALIKTLRDAVSVFHNLAHELWKRGLRLRIVPVDKQYCDVPGLEDLNPEKHVDTPGIYFISRRIVAVREEYLLYSTSVKVKYTTFIHEMAHAIWFLILWQKDRDHISHLYQKERVRRQHDTSYRMKDVREFFAESFVYYITPHRKGRILGIESRFFGRQRIRVVTEESAKLGPDVEDLKNANIEMLAFLEAKFKNVIDPELIMAQPQNDWEELRHERWGDEQLFLPVTHSTDNEDDGPIYNW